MKHEPIKPSLASLTDVTAAVIDYHVAFSRARRFGLRCEAKMPPMDGEQSRIANEFNSAQYWQGLATKDERDAAMEEIDRASRSYWTRGTVAYPAKGRSQSVKLRRILVERDGTYCWLCGGEMPTSDRTIEHLVAKSNGGTDDPENLVLCHEACNKLLGNLPIEVKRDLRRTYQEVA